MRFDKKVCKIAHQFLAVNVERNGRNDLTTYKNFHYDYRQKK